MYCEQVEGAEGFTLAANASFQIKQMGQPFVPAEYFYLPYLKGI